MNTTKRDRIKQEIEFADIDFQDIDKSISRMELKRNAEYVKTGKPVSLSDVIDKSNLTDYEKQNRENSIAYKMALVCEHYLKALTINGMHFSDVENESDEELNRIFSSKARDGGIVSFSHHLRQLVYDNPHLSLDIKYFILMSLAYQLKDEELVARLDDLKNLFDKAIEQTPVSSNEEKVGLFNEISKLLKEMYERIERILNDNDSAFIKSRYGMFDGYKANIDFLQTFASILRNAIQRSISQCLYVDLMQRHIFYDLDTDILFLFENGDGELIHTTSGKNVIEEYERKIGTERITRLGMNSPTSVFLKEVHYTDSNEKKGLFYDEMTDSYAIMK